MNNTCIIRWGANSFRRKAYLFNTSIENSRMMIKTDGLACESCNKVQTETQAHVLLCPAYDKLREGLKLSNQDYLIKYFGEVMMARDKLGTK